MSWSFNPFTGNLDIVGGGAVVFEGEVETFADLSETIGDPAVGASFLVRSSTGVWLVNRRQAGIWIRRNNTGVRATDWEYGGDYPVNSVNGQTGNVSLTATNVGAAWPLVVTSQFISANTALSAGRNRRITLSAVNQTVNVDLPYSGNADGDVVTLVASSGLFTGSTLSLRTASGMSGGAPSTYAALATMTAPDQSFTFVSDGTATGWRLRPVDTHTHAASQITGAFTTLAANNGTLTASAPVLDLAQTWNNAAVTFTGLQQTITNTASANGSRLFNFVVGSTSVLSARTMVGVGATDALMINGGDRGLVFGSNTTANPNAAFFSLRWQANIAGFSSSAILAWGSDVYNVSYDLAVQRDAADTFAQRRGTNAQTFRLYNTYTDASNYERGFMRWSSNVLQIGTEKAGTGSARALEFQTDGTTRWTITTAGLLTAAPADNGGFVLSNGWMNYRAGTTNHWAVVSGNITARSAGYFQWSGGTDASNFSGDTLRLSRSSGGTLLLEAGSSTEHRLQFGGTTSSFPALKRSSTALQVRLADDSADAPLSCSDFTVTGNITTGNANELRLGTSGAAILVRETNFTLAQRNAGNAQSWRLYNSFITSTTFERLNIRWASNECIIDAEAGSVGGTLRGIKIGSATSSLLGFYGATPVDRPATVADPTGGGTVDAEARTAINDIIDRLQELGLIA